MLDHRQKHYGLLALLFASYADTVTRVLTKQSSTTLKLVLFNRRITKDMFHKTLRHFVDKYQMPTILHPCDHLLSRSTCTVCVGLDCISSDIFRMSKTACRSAMAALHKATECGADPDELLEWVMNVNATAIDLIRDQAHRPTFGSTCAIYDALCDWSSDSRTSRFGFACCVAQLTLGLPCPIFVQPFETLCPKDVMELHEIIIPWFKTIAHKVSQASVWPQLLREETCYKFIRHEYAPVAINFITTVQENHMKFYMTMLSITNDVWGVSRTSGILKHLLTAQYKDLLVHPVSNMFHLICPVIPLYNMWSYFLGVDYNNMCLQNICTCCYKSVNISVPLLLPQCLCLRCFEDWTINNEKTAQNVVSVFCTSPSFGPPMTEIMIKNWKQDMERVVSNSKTFASIPKEKNEYLSFVELIFEMKKRSFEFKDKLADGNTRIVGLVVNPDGQVTTQTIHHKIVTMGILNLFHEDARVVSFCMHQLQLPFRDQRASVVFELQPADKATDTNAWAEAIGKLYNKIPIGWIPVGPAYIFQECSPSSKFKGLVDIFAQTAQAAVGHVNPCLNQDYTPHIKPSWNMRRVDKKSNTHTILYLL